MQADMEPRPAFALLLFEAPEHVDRLLWRPNRMQRNVPSQPDRDVDLRLDHADLVRDGGRQVGVLWVAFVGRDLGRVWDLERLVEADLADLTVRVLFESVGQLGEEGFDRDGSWESGEDEGERRVRSGWVVRRREERGVVRFFVGSRSGGSNEMAWQNQGCSPVESLRCECVLCAQNGVVDG
jgi:hypothetical protein